MEKPVVGVVPLWDEQRQSIWMLPAYLDGIRAAGGIPLVLPLTECTAELDALLPLLDGLLFTGGQDVAPALYGEEPLPECGETSPVRDAMEGHLLHAAIQTNLPLLGICRGIQLINARLGGTLYQHLPAQHSSGVTHQQQPPYHRSVHSVNIAPGPLNQLLGVDALAVNSFHHQAIKHLAPPLEAMATSEDGLVEAVRLPSHHFLWAVQWHPEYAPEDAASQKLFQAFIQACLAYKGRAK